MRSRIVKIGNSRGVRIPKALLDEAKLVGEVEITVVDDGLLIAPVAESAGFTLHQLSESALRDWNRPEEDEAWAHLQ